MLRSIVNKIKAITTVLSQLITSTAGDITGATVSLLDYGSLMFVASVGATGETLSGSVYIEIQLQKSADGSNWVAADDADLSAPDTEGTVTGCMARLDANGELSKVIQCGWQGDSVAYPYVRAFIEVEGTQTTGTQLAVVALASHATAEPA